MVGRLVSGIKIRKDNEICHFQLLPQAAKWVGCVSTGKGQFDSIITCQHGLTASTHNFGFGKVNRKLQRVTAGNIANHLT